MRNRASDVSDFKKNILLLRWSSAVNTKNRFSFSQLPFVNQLACAFAIPLSSRDVHLSRTTGSSLAVISSPLLSPVFAASPTVALEAKLSALITMQRTPREQRV